jgi:hypothetical protein
MRRFDYQGVTYLAERTPFGLRWKVRRNGATVRVAHVPLAVSHLAKEWESPPSALTAIRRAEIGAAKRALHRRHTVQAPGDLGTHTPYSRQLALYAANIGQRRSLLPADLSDWALAHHDERSVIFEQHDPHSIRWSNAYTPKVVYAVAFDLSHDALYAWPVEQQFAEAA